MSDDSLKCELLSKEQEILFAGFLDMVGNLIAGSFRSGVKPLKNDEDRKKNVH